MFQAFLSENEEIYRIYFYTAPMWPVDDIKSTLKKRSKKDQKKFESWLSTSNGRNYTKKVQISNNFLKSIVKEDYVALRLGKLNFRGLKSNSYPDFVQKEVDMLFGLDISHIAYLHLADKVMLFSKDTDVVPAMKVARTNGMEVVLPVFEEDDYISEKLVKHCDIFRKRSLLKIYTKNILV